MVSGPVRCTLSCCKRSRHRPSSRNQVNVAVGRGAAGDDGTLERILPAMVAFDVEIRLRQAGVEIVEPALGVIAAIRPRWYQRISWAVPAASWVTVTAHSS